MSHHGVPMSKFTRPTSGAARKARGPNRYTVIKPRIRPQGKLTIRATDATIGKPRGNLSRLKWKAGQPLTPQERRRRIRAKNA